MKGLLNYSEDGLPFFTTLVGVIVAEHDEVNQLSVQLLPFQPDIPSQVQGRGALTSLLKMVS